MKVCIQKKPSISVQKGQPLAVRLKSSRRVSVTTQAPPSGYASPEPISIIEGDAYDIPAGKKLDSISIIPSAGDRVLTIGYSPGAGDLVDGETIASDDSASFQYGIYFHLGQTLHFSGFSGDILIYLL